MGIIYIATDRLEKHSFDKNTPIDTLLEYVTIGDAFRIPDKADRELWKKIIDEGWTELDDVDYFQYDKPYVTNDEWYTEYEGHFVSLEECVSYLTKRIRRIEHIPAWAKIMKLKE